MADWLAKAVCFICYVVYPTTNTRPEIVGSDIWAQLMRFLYSMDAAEKQVKLKIKSVVQPTGAQPISVSDAESTAEFTIRK